MSLLCKHKYSDGIALEQSYVITRDFPGDRVGCFFQGATHTLDGRPMSDFRGQTTFPGGPCRIVKVHKCSKCGHSVR